MRAIVVREFGPPSVMRLQDVADPAASAGTLVVRVRAAGVNPVDTYIRGGAYARLPQLPYTPGFDGAGEVESVGDGVTGWARGDHVFIAALGAWHGTYAERMVCTPSQVFRLPDHVSYGQGASLGVPAATAHRALFGKAHAQGGETVLIHGASGAVGIAAVQLAKAAGLRVIGTAGTDDGRALVLEQGADTVFDHRDPARVSSIKTVTDGRGPDVILEMLANVNLDTDLGLLAPGGRVVVIGNRGRTEIDARQTMGKELTITGMSLWNVPPDEMLRIQQALAAALANRTLRPVVGREFPLEDAPQAHEVVTDQGARGKVVLNP
ncbi:MAG TPA: NADPH:quinone reductase [Vicinamibacterales bacterium]|jgi:NADPH2:quinone reductase|nr:NADPH:quinone reductase [Vicinamibacterales bacterium]